MSGPDVFLSHSSRDKRTVERIARALRGAGIEPWLDAWHLTPGGDWQSEIAAALRAARSCAVFVGGEGLGDWELQELGLALDRAAKDRHFRVFAVLLPGVPEPFDPTQLPPFISTRTWVDFRGGFNDPAVFQRLTNAVMGVPIGAEEPAARPATSPYQGLQTFDEEHAEFFFGRDADVQRLLERLKERRFLAVLGPSGSGKSSLVRAGLVPALRRGAVPGSDTWRIAVLRPGTEPLASLAATLLDLGDVRSMQATVDLLAEDPRTLHLAVTAALATGPAEEHAVFVVDQFEEVFTLTRRDEERRAFLATLLHAALVPGGRTHVVITMRADFYPRCSAYPELAQAVSGNQFLAWPMAEWALAEAIEEPARVVGLELEEGLTDQILADLRDAPGALPLMEHTLLEVWERRRGTMLTLEAYRDAGGVAGSLAKRADAVYATLTESDRETARRVLLRLTQPGEGTEDTRRRASLEELTGADGAESVERVVGELTAARLLTTGADGDRFVEVSHEALIRGWPRLREWLDEDRAGLRTHRRLTEAAHEWDRAGREPEGLYRGARLAQAAEWAERDPGAPNPLEAEFLRASVHAREAAQRRRQRRTRAVAAALSAGLLAMSALAVIALVQRERADGQRERADDQSRVAQSREIAAAALEQLERDPQLSLLLSIEAHNTAPTEQADAALRRALVSSPLRRLIRTGSEGDAFLDISPDGSLIAVGGADVSLWELGSGRRVARIAGASRAPEGPGREAPALVSFSPDGKRLYVGHPEPQRSEIRSVPDGRRLARLDRAGFFAAGWAPDGSAVLTQEPRIRLFDADTGKARVEFRGGASSRSKAEGFADLSPDGRLVAYDDGGRVRIADAASGHELAVLDGRLSSPTEVLSTAFSPDSRLIALDAPAGARIFAARSGRLVRTLARGLDPEEVAFSPDGRRVGTSHVQGGARIWNVQTGRLLQSLSGDVLVPMFSRDGSLVLTSGQDSRVRIWDAETGRQLAVYAGHAREFPWARFSPDGRFVVTVSGDVRVWEVPAGAAAVLRGHRGSVISARFSADGRSIVSGDLRGTARLWDVASRRPRRVLRMSPTPASAREVHVFAEFGADGRTVVTSGIRVGARGILDAPLEQEPTRLWDSATGTVRKAITPPDADPARRCPEGRCPAPDGELSPDGRRLATVGEDGFLRVYNAADDTAAGQLDLGAPAAGVAWTPDGRRLLALAANALHLVDARRLRKLGDFGRLSGGGGGIPALDPEVNADGSLVAVSYAYRTARVWEIATRRMVAELPHAEPVSDVAFSPNGRFVVTASGESPTIWDLRTQRSLVRLVGHHVHAGTVDFAPDGRSVLSGGDDGTVRIWRCEVCAPVEDVLRLARSRAVRRLTAAERAQFLHERP